MKIRLGYVAIALNLEGITSSSALTFSRYKNLTDEERINKLKSVTLSNIVALKEILHYNIKNNIHFYRLTSKLIPLASHPEVHGWPYYDLFKKEFEEIGEIIHKNNLRVDTHPDHFNVINSDREEVFEATLRELEYHENIFEMMNYKDGKMILHIGKGKDNKKESIEKFVINFNRLPQSIQDKIILENDDRIFTMKDTLSICRRLQIPMVLDYHHYICNRGEDKIEDHIYEILNTWKGQTLLPKFHISGPREGDFDRKHSDLLDSKIFLELVGYLKKVNTDVDIMIESKQKDRALLRLVDDIKRMDLEIEWIDESTLQI